MSSAWWICLNSSTPLLSLKHNYLPSPKPTLDPISFPGLPRGYMEVCKQVTCVRRCGSQELHRLSPDLKNPCHRLALPLAIMERQVITKCLNAAPACGCLSICHIAIFIYYYLFIIKGNKNAMKVTKEEMVNSTPMPLPNSIFEKNWTPT